MRFHVSILSALTVSQSFTAASADDCQKICTSVRNLCPADKGSWCNKSGNCQNIFMTKDSDLCYLSSLNPCTESEPVKCKEAEDKVREKFLFDEARRLAREVPEEQKPKLQLRYELPPVNEMGAFCVIC